MRDILFTPTTLAPAQRPRPVLAGLAQDYNKLKQNGDQLKITIEPEFREKTTLNLQPVATIQLLN
jgi:hypothetical protein